MAKQFGRPDNKSKLEFYIQDSEQTMLYKPTDYTGNKFIGTYSKLIDIGNMIFYEQQEKYMDKLNA